MRGGGLLLKVAVTAVLVRTLAHLHSGILLSVWRSRTSNMMQLPQFRLDRMEDAPLHTGVTLDIASNHTAKGTRLTSHGKSSGNVRGQHIRPTYHGLEKEFKRRHLALLRECNKYDARISFPEMNWRLLFKYVLPGPLTLFRVPKAGSSATEEIIARVKEKTAAAPRTLSAVVVRHPLARLASAYRDKFLNGKSLFEYDDEWRNVTQSYENWDTRFGRYWLPALVSEGFVHRTREFNETLNKIRIAYKVYLNNYVSQSGARLAYPSQEENHFYGVEEMGTAHLMMLYGPRMGFPMIFKNAYNLSDLQQRFRSTSFTFSEFLRHVVWTHDMGMPNEHWMTYTEMCDPCRMKFDYILKLETIQEEIQHLFCGVLGFPDEVSFPVKHRSYGHGLGHHDREYYANVSRELLHRLLDIYRLDFAIFGYSQDL